MRSLFGTGRFIVMHAGLLSSLTPSLRLPCGSRKPLGVLQTVCGVGKDLPRSFRMGLSEGGVKALGFVKCDLGK